MRNGIKYTAQRYQGVHKAEFLLRSESGDVFLFENNVLKQKWQENEKGKRSEEFTAYKNGRVDFSQRFEDILEQRNFNRITNYEKSQRMEIWSVQTGHLLYHGGYNERRMKEGWGIEYDEESGNVVVEGMWSKGVLKEVIRCFNGDTMTELKRNGADSLDPTKRIPIYVGGFRYDEDNERFIREGKGCLIDEKTGIATRECEWKDGAEVSGVDLTDGWYHPVPLQLVIQNTKDLTDMSLQVTDLTISSNCCNDLNQLDLNNYNRIRSIEIGDDCFESVLEVKIEGLNRLRSLKIGKNSFTQVKESDWENDNKAAESRVIIEFKSFTIMNCKSLKTIEIGEGSFSDYGGDFVLRNLNSLQSITVGKIGTKSWNFDIHSSFILQGQ